MTFDTRRQFDRFQTHQWNDADGRGTCVIDTADDNRIVARFRRSVTSYRDAKAEAARRNLAAYEEVVANE